MNRAQQSATTIADKRPKVVVYESEAMPGRWRGSCHVPGCVWAYSNVVKSDVTMQGAAWHRQAHRAAVKP